MHGRVLFQVETLEYIYNVKRNCAWTVLWKKIYYSSFHVLWWNDFSLQEVVQFCFELFKFTGSTLLNICVIFESRSAKIFLFLTGPQYKKVYDTRFIQYFAILLDSNIIVAV